MENSSMTPSDTLLSASTLSLLIPHGRWPAKKSLVCRHTSSTRRVIPSKRMVIYPTQKNTRLDWGSWTHPDLDTFTSSTQRFNSVGYADWEVPRSCFLLTT